MSKYIESRKQKIQELSEQLNIVNQRIDSYALRLKSILSDYSNVYQLYTYDTIDIQEDPSLYSKNFYISFYYNDKYNSFSFSRKEFFFRTDNLPFGIVSTLNSFIQLMDEEFGLNTISQDITESESIYSKIKTLYLEIFKKNSDFSVCVDSFSQLIIDFNEKNDKSLHSLDNTISFYFKKNNKLQYLEFLTSDKDKKFCLNFKIPTIEDLFNIYEQNKNKGQFQFIEILNLFLKNEILLLNKELIELFNIDSKKIKTNISFHNPYGVMNNIKDLKSNLKLHINLHFFEKEQLKLINEKFQSIKQLENF